MSFMAGSKRAEQKRKLVASAKQRSMLNKNKQNKQYNRVRTASNLTRQIVKTVSQSEQMVEVDKVDKIKENLNLLEQVM